MLPVGLDQQIAEVRRELGMRRHKYPQWVAAGRMTQQQADERIAAMDAARSTLEQLRDEQRARVEPGLF